jgi:hypothetical protein
MRAYIDQLVDFTNAALNGTPPPASGADGRAGVALLESSHIGQVVYLK